MPQVPVYTASARCISPAKQSDSNKSAASVPARTPMSDVGVVIIGRNEGKRLIDCIQSVTQLAQCIVYVNANSCDGSASRARAFGVHVVELDASLPFTAARARNEGYDYLSEIDPGIAFVQFLDGDCILDNGWLVKAHNALEQRYELAIVCGRTQQRFPNRSVYNSLCNLEQDSSVGNTTTCGGNFMVKAELFATVGGFNDSQVAGEDTEICLRLQREGYKILRLDTPMSLHDANIIHFGQWWKRNVQAGYAANKAASLQDNKKDERYLVGMKSRSSLFWAGVLPAVIITGTMFSTLSLASLLLYPLHMVLLASKAGITKLSSWQYAFFTIVSYFPVFQGKIYHRGQQSLGKKYCKFNQYYSAQPPDNRIHREYSR